MTIEPYEIIARNKARRTAPPFWALLFLSCFGVWQMGVFFYSSSALSINPGTPFPFDADITVWQIIVGYLLSIVILIPLQRYCVVIARVCLIAALLCCVGMFLPFPLDMLVALFYLEGVICVLFIGIIVAASVTLLSTDSTLVYCLLMSILAGVFVPLLRGGLFRIDFAVFNALSLVLIVLMLAGFLRLPARADVEYCPPGQGEPPRTLRLAVYVYIALSNLITLFGSSYSETVEGGLPLFYISSGAGSLLFLYLCRKKNASPFKLASAYILTAGVGFLLAIASLAFPLLKLLVCALMGLGMSACILSEFFAACLFERSASRFVVPLVVAIALAAVVVQSATLGLLRGDSASLAAVYGVIVVLGVAVYMKIEPHVSYSWTHDDAPKSVKNEAPVAENAPWFFASLSPQERVVTDLIMRGYATREISEITGLSVNTQKFYRKNIYLKLGIHSRSELFELVWNKPE